ncbi:M55 family metallopeptidase [Plantactinospora sp. KLBMP9567]|uniref:M55 family metallopeptidase n=1 Tax=Plantactinospora sp. KLBMP9567 TaxID=3085900 RepID=UPI0029814DEF|nr:M55 family metallopeptidase [Plantactinospora sp. KLBMP9567]MDW5325004.1 M55 family metallopeptidase [Plantactinospora sp. KLBMP9567]
MTNRPKVLISADLEGVSGVVHPTETNPGGYDYERGRALMTAEVNAAIAGVLDAEPDAEVSVADSHGPFRNLLPEELDGRVRLIRGRPRPLGMVAGLEAGVEALLFVGYHARAGAGPAVLAHTISDAVLDLRIDGRSVGEIGLNAAVAGHYGVPVVLLSGDDAACAELRDLVPEAVTVEVKRALGQAAAETLHPREARDRIRLAAAEAVRGRRRVRPVPTPTPVRIELDLYGPYTVDLATLVPGVSRAAGGRTLTFTGRDMAEAYRVVQLLVQLAQIKPG